MPVHVIITDKITGDVKICPFIYPAGLQYYIVRGVKTDTPVLYKVPAYEVRIDGGNKYDAVRFGLQNKGVLPPPTDRKCDAGLANPQVWIPEWIADYSPHSFVGGIRKGAWRLIPGKAWLIHEGADRGSGYGGSLGCIEILDGHWNGFLDEIETLGGDTCAQIATARGLKVTIVAAVRPTAHLIP